MNMYQCKVKLEMTKTIKKTTNVIVQAADADKAKLQLEVIYGKQNVVTCPVLVKE